MLTRVEPMKQLIPVKKVSMITGMLTAIPVILFFLTLRYFHLHRIIELRFFNLIFLFFGVLYAVARKRKELGEISYLEGIKTGFLTSFTCGGIFAVFLLVYLLFIDPYFMQYIIDKAPLGHFMTPWIIAGVIFNEAISSGVILSLIVVQFFKSTA